MNVLLLKTWKSNIGNGFIDAGAREIIDQAFPEAEVLEASGFPNLVSHRKSLGEMAGIWRITQKFGGKFAKDILQSRSTLPERMVNIGELADVDLCILPGCVLYEHVLEKYDTTIQKVIDDDIPLVILGGGGGNYKNSTKKYVKNYINGLNKVALLSRDTSAYEAYEEDVDYAYDGIDCAFFVSDWFSPPEANQEFVTSTFDKTDNNIKSNDYKVIRTNHTPFGDERPYQGTIKKILDKYKKRGFFASDNIFVSDSIQDYLFLYSNTTEVHADRIHACVPALAYGNSAKFYFDTPRAELFDRILDQDISKKPVRLSKEKLDSEKEAQVTELQAAVNEITG